MNYYIYYRPNAEPDIAIVESSTKKEAIERLKQFYHHVSSNHVTKVDCHREGYPEGIMIIGKY